MKKLKRIDFKTLLIDHGEKLGFAITILIVVGVLCGTTWSRYERSPGDLQKKITDTQSRINAATNQWPAAKSDQFALVDFNRQAQAVFTELPRGKYEFTTPMFWALHRKKDKAREPEFYAPLYLIADSGYAALLIDDRKLPQEAPATDEPRAESTLRPGPRDVVHGANGGHGGGANGGHANRGLTHDHRGGTVLATEAVTEAASMTRGKRYIALRAIVPIKEQIERAMKALNMNYANASAAIEYTDFILQRQVAIAGPDPWAGKWETVDKKFALEVLQTCTDFDPDPVPTDLQDAVFTMPLPYRLLRYWGDHATHPNIKNFRLSDAEMERERELYSKVMEETKRLQLESRPKVEKKGLWSAVNDMRANARSLAQNPAAMQQMTRLINEMNPGNGPRMGTAELKNRLTASGRVYLFRYFDFDVLPGMAYRYRLKLELKNPNFERPYDEVEDHVVTKHPYRETAWSNISNPAVVPDTVQYFLKDVERDPIREDKHSRKPVASIAMFEWNEKYGTMLADSLKILNVGQFIAEKKKSWVLDPGTPRFEEEDVAFAAEDLLVDASGDVEIAADLHPELHLKPQKGRKDIKVGIRPEALVATSYGKLEELDPATNDRERMWLDQQVKEERKNFEYLRDTPQQTNSILDGPDVPRPAPSPRPRDPRLRPR